GADAAVSIGHIPHRKMVLGRCLMRGELSINRFTESSAWRDELKPTGRIHLSKDAAAEGGNRRIVDPIRVGPERVYGQRAGDARRDVPEERLALAVEDVGRTEK